MTFWQQWVRQPQSLWLRKVLFQVHLWIGLAIGLYIVVLSVTGSAIVYGPQLMRALDTPTPTFDPSREALSTGQLTEAAERSYPGYKVTSIASQFSRRRPVIRVSLERGDDVRERLLNPYTGEDLGDVFPIGVRAVLWVTSLHDDLLFGQSGRDANGVGSVLATLLALSGAILWWPGKKKWRRSLLVNRKAGWARFNWELHSMAGFWCFALILIWSISGIYLVFPQPFNAIVDYFWPAALGERPGDKMLAWLVRLHFGRFRDMRPLQVVWVVLGLVPAMMFATGALMWWNRVFRKSASASNDAGYSRQPKHS